MQRRLIGLAVPAILLAQGQATWYAAWEDGREAERQHQWARAAAAYERAINLQPKPAGRRLAYGSTFVWDYYPYAHLARCRMEAGDLAGAEAALDQSERQKEPEAERGSLRQRLAGLKVVPTAPPVPVPTPVHPTPAPSPAPPTTVLVPTGPVPEPRTSSPENLPPRPVATPDPAVPVSVPTTMAVPPSPTAAVNPPAAPQSAPQTPAAPVPPRGAWMPWAMAGGLGLVGLLALLRFRRKPAPFLPGEPERMGPYVIEDRLGRGGFATTYRARHAGTGQKVALKVLHPYRQDDAEFAGRFRQEARLGALLDHPHIVRLLDPGPSEGTLWLAMEHVEGVRLDVHLRDHAPLPMDEALRIARQVAEAMAYSHGKGIVHRDLKPANIMLVEGQVKVMDFGIARQMDAETLTATYAFLGTPLYAAPEVQLSTRIGPEADRYSLGILLFELLAGSLPFQGETPFQVLDMHRTQPLPDLATLRPGLPEALASLVAALCSKDPAQRPDDEAILAVLRNV